MHIEPKYEFFLADLCFLFIWLVLYFLRPDLKRKFIKFSIYCGIMGLVTEYWFFEDYWQPLTVFGKKIISFEDFLCGFTIGGMSFTLYDVIFRKKDVRYLPKKRKEFKYLFVVFILFMFFLINLCGLNTIFVNSIALLGFAAYMVIKRNDLLLPTLYSGVLLTVLMLVVYHVIFNIFFPDFWKRSWLFENTSHGIYIYKNIPLSEIIWYFSWGSFAGVAHNYSSGQKKVSINEVIN
jgi:hypothetical protein